MPITNITIAGKVDGFGCQLNAKLSGVALCENDSRYRYVHTPFVTLGHGWSARVEDVNRWMNFPYSGRRINKTLKRVAKVHSDPALWYNNKALTTLRTWYWRGPSEKTVADVDIAVHIRRGDVHPRSRINPYSNSKKVCLTTSKRYSSNEWYSRVIPEIAANYPDDYLINIYSEGSMADFASIAYNWSDDLLHRLRFKIDPLDAKDKVLRKPLSVFGDNNMLKIWHEMVSAKVLVQAKSGLSYTAGIYNENDVWFSPGSLSTGQTKPLKHWKIFK